MASNRRTGCESAGAAQSLRTSSWACAADELVGADVGRFRVEGGRRGDGVGVGGVRGLRLRRSVVLVIEIAAQVRDGVDRF